MLKMLSIVNRKHFGVDFYMYEKTADIPYQPFCHVLSCQTKLRYAPSDIALSISYFLILSNKVV